jgi:putative ABC transport system permease protein
MIAFIVPMLTVLGIRDGIIGTLTRRLLENPRNLEITPKGTQSFSLDFFEPLQAHPDAAFLVPQIRDLSSTINLIVEEKPSFDADLYATGPNDPLLKETVFSSGGERPLGLEGIYISENVAEKLEIKAGSELTGRIGRNRGGKAEYVRFPLTVLGVIPRHITPKNTVFCSLDLLRMTEEYRNGYSVPELEWDGREKPDVPILYSRFRLYAKDLDGVERLRLHLAGLGVETLTQAAQIKLVKDLDHSFTVVFLALFIVVGGGAFASAASGSIDQVLKMRRSLAILALLGISKIKLLVFTMFQAALTGLLATIGAEILFLILAKTLNTYFGGVMSSIDEVCSLSVYKLALAAAITVVFMITASGCAYTSLADIEPSEGMREI